MRTINLCHWPSLTFLISVYVLLSLFSSLLMPTGKLGPSSASNGGRRKEVSSSPSFLVPQRDNKKQQQQEEEGEHDEKVLQKNRYTWG